MIKMKTLTKGLLGASVFSLITATNAFALGTAADTPVKNTFTLDYEVANVAQPTISTCKTGDVGCTVETSTNFTVDRLIDLTVNSTANATVAPGATGQTLEFSVTNTGNDTQAYDLSLDDVTDTFTATSVTLLYYVDDGDGIFEPGAGAGLDGAGVPYVPGTTGATADIAADGVLWVVVTGDIPITATNTQTDGIVLVADTLQPTTGASPGTAEIADTDGNDNDLSVVENVLGDSAGITDLANQGDHSDTGTFVVAAANVAATKAVTVHLLDGVDAATCGTFPGTPDADPLSIPGSCVEYLITVTNPGAASATATEIVVSDFLPQELTFAGAEHTGFDAAPVPTFATPTAGTDCSPTSTTCQVLLSGASLTADQTGLVRIRALIQ